MLPFSTSIMKNKTTFLVIAIFLYLNLNAQTISIKPKQNLPLSREMILSVKQLNQFADRFNYEKDFSNDPIDTVFKKKMPRVKYLEYLFDKHDMRGDSLSALFSIDYKIKINHFIEDVSSELKPYFISYNYDGVYAEVSSDFLYKKN